MVKPKKNDELKRIIELPEGIEARVEGKEIIMKTGEAQIKRKIDVVEIKIEGKNIVISAQRTTKKERKMISTYTAHIRNMIKGLKEKYLYKLKVCNVHFPMTVSVDKAKNELIVKNFLGEKQQRKAKILEGVEVKVEGAVITVESHDKEKAGQTAANFEKATKVRLRDRRIFQDGIFLTEKPGVII
ncbi:50S ribosomal protein L6 [Candidatus Pacearchaeota archaeon CG10_big_fil_rev_8_21_14_0_10_35_13]|nr:MAG: 50S ribosomal protein L6 [Candidatus Pacearchaeota archaeon CG10_big_fil_rev_8_21_14_0_10_35_13]